MCWVSDHCGWCRGQEKVLDCGVGSQKPQTFLFHLIFWAAPLALSSELFLRPVDSDAPCCWGLCLLNATEGPQLHRCVPYLQGVLSLCLEQPPLQDCWPWWRAGEAPFGSFSFEVGVFVPRQPTPPSHCLLSWLFFWKQGKLPGKGIHHGVWPRALHLTLVPKWKNVHGVTRVLWCRDRLFPFVVLWQTRSDQPTLSLWRSVTPERVEKSFTVHGADGWLCFSPPLQT